MKERVGSASRQLHGDMGRREDRGFTGGAGLRARRGESVTFCGVKELRRVRIENRGARGVTRPCERGVDEEEEGS